MHVILDNFSTHKTDLVKRYLEQHPNVTLHFTPTYSSWLNQVESWFSKLQRDVIDRGIFTSVADLKRKILRYIRLYQKTANPFNGNTPPAETDPSVVAMSQGQPTRVPVDVTRGGTLAVGLFLTMLTSVIYSPTMDSAFYEKAGRWVLDAVGPAVVAIFTHRKKVLIALALCLLASFVCLENYMVRESHYADVVPKAIETELEDTPQRQKGLEAFLMANQAPDVASELASSKLTPAFIAAFNRLGANFKQAYRPDPGLKIFVETGFGGKTILTDTDRAAQTHPNEPPGFLFLPLNTLHVRLNATDQKILDQDTDRGERSRIITRALTQDPVLLSDIRLTRAMARTLQEFTTIPMATEPITQSPETVFLGFKPVQVYVISATGLNRIFKPDVPSPNQIYGQQFTATTFFPSRFYFWRSLEGNVRGWHDAKESDTVSSFFSVSKPYFDLGGNSVVITVSKGIRSVMSDVVICFDLALSYRNKFQEALHRKINELDGETVEVECRIPIGAGATCHPETVNPYSRIDPWYLRLRNFLLGSDERAKVRANLTKALQQYIGEAKGELASVCGDLKVLNPKRTPGNPAEPIQFSIPLSSNFMGSPREATFLLAQLNLADFQKQTTLWALAGSLLFGGGFLGLLWVLGNEIGTRREAETAFKKVAYVMSCAPVAYTRLDATDRVVDANQKFLDLLGYSEFAQIRGKALKSFLADRASEIEYEGVQQQRLANKDVLPYDIAFRQRDGTSTIRWVVSADIPASRAGKSDLPETFGIFLQDRPPDPSVP